MTERREVHRIEVDGLKMALGAAPRTVEDALSLRQLGITQWIHHGRKPLPPEVWEAFPRAEVLLNPTADDGDNKPASWFAKSLVFARGAQVSNGCLLVTCSRGIHRAPAIAYAVLRTLLSVGEPDAIKLIYGSSLECRPRYIDDVETEYEAIRAILSAKGRPTKPCNRPPA